MTKKMIDPPEGWKYGFPMEYTPLEGETMKEFVVRNGYPQALLNIYNNSFYCRFYWQEGPNEIVV